MDFTLTAIQREVAGLAAEVLERSQAGHGTTQWKELAQAGLLALALPDWLGGNGLGLRPASPRW